VTLALRNQAIATPVILDFAALLRLQAQNAFVSL